MVKVILYVAALVSAYAAGRVFLQTRTGPAPPPARAVTATLTAIAAIATTSILQFAYPSVLMALRRDSTAVMSGEPWRLVTAILVQDGGIAGTIFNLAALLLVGAIAERLCGTRRWVVLFVVGALLSEIVALGWQPTGAGNSVANFSLAGAVCVWCLSRRAVRAVSAAALVSIAAAVLLLAMRDIHGAAFCIGGILGALLARGMRADDHIIRNIPA